MFKNFLLLRRAKKKFRLIGNLYQKKMDSLSLAAQRDIEGSLLRLREAIVQKNMAEVCLYTDLLQDVANRWMKESAFHKAFRFVGSLAFALVVAIVIRQMWFELYTIPTGSMRPTLKESDFLVVSKTDFGLNVPLQTKHFYFDPSLVKRGSIVVFTGENMDIADSDTMYFGIFPGKKQFVKRLIGKPGDTLYFYGGKIYGVDSDGKELKDLQDPKWFQKLEHIPFIRFDGKVETSGIQGTNRFMKSSFYQMNKKVAEAEINAFGSIQGKMISSLEHYSDLWGFKNFAMSRLLTQEQVDEIYPEMASTLKKSALYLELKHHPSLKEARFIRDETNRMRPDLGFSISLIPLDESHLHRIMDHMTTCRFIVDDEKAHRLGFDGKDPYYSRYLPKLVGVPNGTYEIQDGKAYRVYWGGITKELPLNHPLYDKSSQNIHTLYNLGIEFFTYYQPSKNTLTQPSRYSYFRNGDLYLMGAPVLMKEEAVLNDFIDHEKQRQLISTSVHPYLPFTDAGAPLTKEGELDVSFIRKYGLKVPDKMYLMLGDNHAMSADSRQFGFVPQDNLKGGVSFLFSPPGSRFGSLSQPSHSYFGLPNVFVWGSATLITIGYVIFRKRRKALLIFEKKHLNS